MFLKRGYLFIFLLLFSATSVLSQGSNLEYVVHMASHKHIVQLALYDSIDNVFRGSNPEEFTCNEIVFLLQNRYGKDESVWVQPYAEALEVRCSDYSINKAFPFILVLFDYYLQNHNASKTRNIINTAIQQCDTSYHYDALGSFYLYQSYLYNKIKYDSAVLSLQKSTYFAAKAGNSCTVAQATFRQAHLALIVGQYPLAEKLMRFSIPELDGCDGYRYNVYYNAKYLLGLALFLEGKYLDAIASFEEVLNNHYDELAIPDIWNIYELLGNIYMEQGLFDQAEQMHRNALFLRQERLKIVNEPDSTDLGVAYSYNNLAEVLLKKCDPDSAMAYAKASFEIKLRPQTHASKADIASSALNVGAAFLYKENIDSASYYTDMAHHMYSISMRKREVLTCKLQQGEIFLLCGNYQRVIHKADSAIILAQEINRVASIAEAYHLKSLAYNHLHDFKQAYAMLVKYEIIHDTLIRSENIRQVSSMLSTHDAMAKKKIIAFQERIIEQTKDYNNLLLISISVVFFLSIIIIVTLIYQKNRKYVAVNKEKQIVVRENAVLEKEIEQMNRDLICSAKTILDRENVIKNMVRSVKEIHRKDDTVQIDLNRSITAIEKSLNGDGWKEFEIRFKTAYPEFNHQLQHLYPNLSPTEWKLCTFLKLNLTTKQIAEMMHIAPSSVDVSRSRLRKKMNLERGVNLVEFIASL